tara:strand:+ start:496 stop:1197 length:702 start_codon:yes stop_codon:yes gene_type:complete
MIDWFMIHYIAGSGGKMIAVCSQTSKGFHPWFDPADQDPRQLAQQHHGDRRTEPMSPYPLAFVCKTPPWTRGHDLSVDEAEQACRQEFDPRGTVTMYHCHPNIPAWFQGARIRITHQTPQEQQWVQDRRQRLFYRHTEQGVIDLRKTELGSRPAIVRGFPQPAPDPRPLPTVIAADWRREQIDRPSEHEITVADIIDADPDHILDQIDQATGTHTNRAWCRPYIQAWREHGNW